MCVFFFDDFTMFLPSLLYWIKFNWAFICLLLFVFHFLILFFIWNPPFLHYQAAKQWVSLA
jgi:hypothetical protein